jgi:hypothetical protein
MSTNREFQYCNEEKNWMNTLFSQDFDPESEIQKYNLQELSFLYIPLLLDSYSSFSLDEIQFTSSSQSFIEEPNSIDLMSDSIKSIEFFKHLSPSNLTDVDKVKKVKKVRDVKKYSRHEKQQRIQRFKNKKQSGRISIENGSRGRYPARQHVANSRHRYLGRFISNVGVAAPPNPSAL